MKEHEVLPCPFCGRQPDINDNDTLYPTGRFREVDGFYVAVFPGDEHPDVKHVWGMHCKESSGGCGAKITGYSEQEAIDRWNRRAALSAPPAERMIEVLRAERDAARAQTDFALRILTGIHALLYPQPLTADGKIYVFQPDTAGTDMQRLCNAIRAIPDQLAAAPQPAAEARERVLPPFREAWAKKEAEGYQYGRDALEQVHFGYQIARDILDSEEA